MTLREQWDALVTAIRREYVRGGNTWPWVVKYSAGKDSSFLWLAVAEAIRSAPRRWRKRKVYLVHNDTSVENPVMAAYAREQLASIQAWAKRERLPVECVITEPDIRESFWFCLLGMGYPTPWRKFRWCTTRLKIRPGDRFISERVSASGHVIVLLGTRLDESDERGRSVMANEVTDAARFAPDPKQVGARKWQPIKDWRTDDVWATLLQRPRPWGGSFRDLQTLYANSAEADACQLVMFEEDADACGTGGRMGCWTCTVVPKDKSLVSMVARGREDLEPLVDFRNWLMEMRNDPRNRERFRRNGQHMHDGLGRQKHIGPFTLEAREKMLTELLKLQGEVGLPLIRQAEVDAIRRQWAVDMATEAERVARGEALLVARAERQKHEAETFTLKPR